MFTVQLFSLNRDIENQFEAGVPPTFSEHHSFVCWEAGGQGLAAQVFFALPQVLPLHRTLASQPPEVSSIARNSFVRGLDTGHLLRSDRTNTPVTGPFIIHIHDHVEKQFCNFVVHQTVCEIQTNLSSFSQI